MKAGVCVRCHKCPATAINKRCKECQARHAEQKRLNKMKGTLPASATATDYFTVCVSEAELPIR